MRVGLHRAQHYEFSLEAEMRKQDRIARDHQNPSEQQSTPKPQTLPNDREQVKGGSDDQASKPRPPGKLPLPE
jgi:hypothetical protein